MSQAKDTISYLVTVGRVDPEGYPRPDMRDFLVRADLVKFIHSLLENRNVKEQFSITSTEILVRCWDKLPSDLQEEKVAKVMEMVGWIPVGCGKEGLIYREPCLTRGCRGIRPSDGEKCTYPHDSDRVSLADMDTDWRTPSSSTVIDWPKEGGFDSKLFAPLTVKRMTQELGVSSGNASHNWWKPSTSSPWDSPSSSSPWSEKGGFDSKLFHPSTVEGMTHKLGASWRTW